MVVGFNPYSPSGVPTEMKVPRICMLSKRLLPGLMSTVTQAAGTVRIRMRAAVFCPGGGVFQRSGKTFPANFVQFGSRSQCFMWRRR